MSKNSLWPWRTGFANITGLQGSTPRMPSLTINLPRWPASAHRRTRDSSASVGLTGDVVLTAAQSQPNESMQMEKQRIPVVILVRVSTAKQETARQISELRQYADGKGYEVLEVCEETISGSAQEDQRHRQNISQRISFQNFKVAANWNRLPSTRFSLPNSGINRAFKSSRLFPSFVV
jgi:hypothetical protein